MPGSVYNILLIPFMGWLVGLSLALVGYLLMLAIKELRQNRRMEKARQRLGLKPALRTGWEFLL